MQPLEGRKELAPREIKFRCRRLDTTIRERAGSSQVPRGAQESERYPGLFFFVSFFSSLLFLKRCSRQKSCAMVEREQTGVSHGSNREKGSPTISIRLFVSYLACYLAAIAEFIYTHARFLLGPREASTTPPHFKSSKKQKVQKGKRQNTGGRKSNLTQMARLRLILLSAA